MPKPKRIAVSDLLDHLRVAHNRAFHRIGALINASLANAKTAAYARAWGIERSLYAVQCLVVGHHEAWEAFLHKELGGGDATN
jgi:hypothetical protein